jgi:hypothetical protein
MWQQHNIYGGFYDRMYGYNPSSNGNTMIASQPMGGCSQLYNQIYPSNSYNARRLQPIQPQPSPQTVQSQYSEQNPDSQIRRLSRPTAKSAAYASPMLDDAGSSGESSFADTLPPAVALSNGVQAPTYGTQSQKRFSTSQPYPLQRTLSVRNGNNLGTYSMRTPSSLGSMVLQQPQPQANQSVAQFGAQNGGSFRLSSSSSFRRSNSGFDAATLQRIDSGFDSRPIMSFRGPGGLERHFSNLGGESDFFKLSGQGDAGGGNCAGTYSSVEGSGNRNGSNGAALQRRNTGSNSLYRMYSFSNPSNGGAPNRGLSSYGSLYGGQNMYGDNGGNGRGGASLYGTMSSGNLQQTYSFAGSGIQGYGSGFALLDGSSDVNEFSGDSSTASSWSTTGNAEYYAPKSASVSPSLSITPPIRSSSLGQFPRSHSAPTSRQASQQRSDSSTSESLGSGQRRRRQRPQKRLKNEEEPQVSTVVTKVVMKMESPSPVPPSLPKDEEILVPVKRRASAPVNATRTPATPFEQMRALRRVQTSAYQSPTPQPPASSATIGRRRGTSGGLLFSGAAVV